MHISISTYQLVYIQCRQRRLFHGWNASSTIGELEVVGYIQVWAATVSRWETNKPQNLNKYNENLDIDIKELVKYIEKISETSLKYLQKAERRKQLQAGVLVTRGLLVSPQRQIHFRIKKYIFGFTNTF